jgi:hypothetical protein
MAPRNGDVAVFDNTSSKRCIWDLNVTLSSLSINTGYSGTVTIGANLTIWGYAWTGGGGDNVASNPANWSGGIVPGNGDNIIFTGTEDCIWDLNITPSYLSLNSGFTGTVTLKNNLTITGNLSMEGGDFNLNDKALNVDGDLLIVPNGRLYATSSLIEVKGDWINRGTVVSGISTVVLSGMNSTVYGNNTFYNLVKITDAADFLNFEAGITQVIINNLTLRGISGNLLLLRSTVEGQQCSLDPRGTRHMSFVTIKDMNNINSITIDAADSEDGGNNSNINFGGEQCVCMGIPQILVQASSHECKRTC